MSQDITTNSAFMELALSAGYKATIYSGRGMFGRMCPAIKTEDNPFKVSYKLGVAMETMPPEMKRELEEIEEHLAAAKADSLGHRTVLYFPTIKWEEPRQEDHGDIDG